MKTALIQLLLLNVFVSACFAQVEVNAPAQRITFMLKNTLGYHRMFRVEGPGIAYGFTMNKHETIPCTWPVGSQLYFSRDGEKTTGLILTVASTDEGKTLTTNTGATETKSTLVAASSAKQTVTIRLRNPGIVPKKVALISYEPGEPGNSTNIFTLVPLVGTASFKFPIGTKLYLANDQQVNIVMSGKRIDENKPFLVIKASDAGQTFNVK